MATLLIENPAGLDHVTPEGHPERVARLEAIGHTLSAAHFAALLREDAPEGDETHVKLCHSARHFDHIQSVIPAEGSIALDGDTFVSPGSFIAAMRGVGAMTRAVDAVLGGEVANAFVLSRPPGHHAESEKPMGFCLFGNAAIAAKYALEHHGLDRVAVVDFDVHHGNGTQDLLWDEARALFVSSHQMPLWPGSGAPTETGAHDNILNLPLDPGSDGSVMRDVYARLVLPRLRNWQPDVIVISAGFDAHRADPLANLAWATEDFAWLTRELCSVAEEVCDGRVVSTLEGGYDLNALAASTAAHVAGLMEAGA